MTAVDTPSDADLARRSARLKLPEWVAGGNPAAFGRLCRWRMETIEGLAGDWKVKLDERVRSKPGNLVQVNRLATSGNAGSAGAYARLSRLLNDASLYGNLPYERVQEELDRIAAVQSERELAPLLYRLTLATTTAAPIHLASTVQQVFKDHLLPIFPEAVAYLVEVDKALGMRYGATRILLQAQDDPSLAVQPPTLSDMEPAFNSARGLFSDTSYGFGAYLSPLFLALSPWIWGVHASRPGGVVIYAFGQSVIGRHGEASELLQLFLPTGRQSGGSQPQISAGDIQAALTWWTVALDRMFTEITDPARYVDDDEQYDVRRNFESLLSVEQVFRNVQSLSAHDRDSHVRRVLLFDTLDSLEGLRRPDFSRMCELSYAQRVLTEITDILEPAAGRVLLPRARAAVAALEQVQSGFFMPSRLSHGGLRVPEKNGAEKVITLERAVAAYLRILRNAGHGFGGRQGGARLREEAILMAHNGDIPVDLPELAYLYLLHLLARSQELRHRQ
jgi:hypothetical protein